MEQAIDRGVARRLFTAAAVEAELGRLAAPGRSGIQAVRTVLDRRLAAERRPPSVLESRMGRLLQRTRLPVPHTEYPVGRYRLDFAWPDARLAVEVDGYLAHSTWDQFGSDRRRQNELALDGWLVLRFRAWKRTTCAAGRRKAFCDKGGVVDAAQVVFFRSLTWDDVSTRPGDVVARISRALAASRPA